MGLGLSSQPLRTCSARHRNEQFLAEKSQRCCRVVTSVMLRRIDISPPCSRRWRCGFCCNQRENICWVLWGWLPALRAFKAVLRSGGRGGEDLRNPRRDFQLLQGGKGFGLSSSVGKRDAWGAALLICSSELRLPTAVWVSAAMHSLESLWKTNLSFTSRHS